MKMSANKENADALPQPDSARPTATVAAGKGRQTDQYRRRPLGWPLRWGTLFAGILTLVLLLIARTLEPNPAGIGTHQQLGLPPCTSIVLFNSPCPACGMTTSWALATRGEFTASARSNVGGLLLALIAMAYVPCSCYFFWIGVGSRDERFSLVLAMSLVISVAAASVQWMVRL